jgi:hypothetical protein
MRGAIAYFVALLAALALMTGSAFAQGQGSDPTVAQYGDAASNVGAGGQAQAPGGGGIPFTGLEVGVLIAVAAVMGGAGIALRRLSRARYD